jgi:hypothetical protein
MNSFFVKDDTDKLPDPKDKHHWAGLLRGQVIAAVMDKFSAYIQLADQKAQAMIILNSILVPVALGWLNEPTFKYGAIIGILTAMISILASILCIYPKRRTGHKPDGTRNLLHFGDAGRMSETDYLEAFNPIFNDLNKLAEETVKDLHDVAQNIIIPKFFWLKVAYGSFFVGNVIAISITMVSISTSS